MVHYNDPVMVVVFAVDLKPRQHNIKMKLSLVSIQWCKHFCNLEEDYHFRVGNKSANVYVLY